MEQVYHYFWKHKITRGEPLPLCGGGELRVIDPGLHNTDSGPDFTNAKLDIDGRRWVGNVEIHVKASDWHRHCHSEDAAYDSVILHAVGVDDARISRKSNGEEIPQYLIQVPQEAFQTYAVLTEESFSDVKCRKALETLSQLLATDWMQSLGIERLQEKGRRVAALVEDFGGDWQRACFVVLARGLGFGLNADPFEQLAKTLSLNFLSRHSDSILQLEALMFGQAGMLDMSQHIFDEYYQQLCREYYFLSKKYSLRPINVMMWKYARTRPQNFPHRRIAMLAAMCREGFSLFGKLIALDEVLDREELRELFSYGLSDYWATHTSFDSVGGTGFQGLSGASLDLLAINVIAPLLYAYGSMRNSVRHSELALEILESIPAENNMIIRQWKNLGLRARDAFESQALLHLRKQYCDARKCLYCRLGHYMLRRTVRQPLPHVVENA